MKDRGKGWWNGPLPWLAYLPFYVMPWLWATPSPADLALSAAGLAVFLPAYLAGSRWVGARLLAAAAVVLAVGMVLARTPSAWTVFPIYAAAMCGQLRPARRAIPAIAVVAVVTAATGMLLHQPVLWWAPGLLLVVLTGGATVSR